MSGLYIDTVSARNFYLKNELYPHLHVLKRNLTLVLITFSGSYLSRMVSLYPRSLYMGTAQYVVICQGASNEHDSTSNWDCAGHWLLTCNISEIPLRSEIRKNSLMMWTNTLSSLLSGEGFTHGKFSLWALASKVNDIQSQPKWWVLQLRDPASWLPLQLWPRGRVRAT